MKRNEFFRKAVVLTGMLAAMAGTGAQAFADDHGFRGRYDGDRHEQRGYDRDRYERRDYRYAAPYYAPRYVAPEPYYAAPVVPYYETPEYRWRLEEERREWLRRHRGSLYGYRPGFSIYIGR